MLKTHRFWFVLVPLHFPADSFKSLGVYVSEALTWTEHTTRAPSPPAMGTAPPSSGKVVRTAAAHQRGPAPKPPGFIHQPLPEEDREDSEGLHPPKPPSALTAAEREEVRKHKVQNQPCSKSVSSPGPRGCRTASSAGVSAYRPVAAPRGHRREDLHGQSTPHPHTAFLYRIPHFSEIKLPF